MAAPDRQVCWQPLLRLQRLGRLQGEERIPVLGAEVVGALVQNLAVRTTEREEERTRCTLAVFVFADHLVHGASVSRRLATPLVGPH